MSAGKKIIAGLKDAVAGRIARATVYRNGKPAQRYTPCDGCGNVTLTSKGRCDCCGSQKVALSCAERNDAG